MLVVNPATQPESRRWRRRKRARVRVSAAAPGRSRLRGGQLGSLNLLVLALALVGPGAGAFFNLSTLGPFPSFLFLATVLSVGALIVYIMASAALPVFMLRKERDSFHVVWHLLLPAVAIVIVAFPLYTSVWPLPASPFNYAVYAVGVWILLGLIMLARLTLSRSDALQTAGRLWSSD
jgi:amino acid transporter